MRVCAWMRSGGRHRLFGSGCVGAGVDGPDWDLDWVGRRRESEIMLALKGGRLI